MSCNQNCFDYTKEIGHYDSIRDFASEEMTYIGLALSTPKVRVNSTPHSFDIPSVGSTRIREYAVAQLANLNEISKDLAPGKKIDVKLYDLSGYTLPAANDHGYHAVIEAGETEITITITKN